MAGDRRVSTETSAGGVVFRKTTEGIRILLIKDPYRRWGLPKGHVDNGESLVQAANREVTEETGLGDLFHRGSLGSIDWRFRLGKKRIHKYCHFFLFEAPTGSPCPQAAEGILACRWFTYADALNTISYENAKHVLRQAGSLIGECGEAGGAKT